MAIATRFVITLTLLLATMASTAAAPAPQDDDEALTLTGCLLLSRRVGVYALHMEYNRIAATGHADLSNHVGHIVTLTGMFEEQGDRLIFMVEEVAHVAPTCETQASLPSDGQTRVG